MTYKITDVAKALSVSPETIREGLKQNVFDFGTAFKKPGKRNYTYVLYPAKVKEILGDVANVQN